MIGLTCFLSASSEGNTSDEQTDGIGGRQDRTALRRTGLDRIRTGYLNMENGQTEAVDNMEDVSEGPAGLNRNLLKNFEGEAAGLFVSLY